MSRTLKKILIVTAVVIALAALLYPKLEPLLAGQNQVAVASGPSAMKVQTVVVKPETLQRRIATTGTILADKAVELRSEVSGKIMAIYLEEGKPVSRGDLLLKINDSELQAQLQQAQYRLNLATQREQRQKKLLEKGGISQEEYDATLNEVNVLRAEANLIKAQIDKTELRAPFDGVVGLKYVNEGSYITSDTQIASLQNIDRVKIDFSVPERYAGNIEVGDKVLFRVQTAEGIYEGNIYAIEPEINPETRTLQLRAYSENQSALLLPGSFANIELILEEKEKALAIPTVALVPELGGQFVYAYRDGKAVKVPVTTGIRSEDKVEIIEGLNPQDTVLVTGLLQVRDGMVVDPTTVEL
jgi:membrane fusion protein (multidrug efflux system)